VGQFEPAAKGTTSQLAEKCIVGLEVSGHDFSRAENAGKYAGLQPLTESFFKLTHYSWLCKRAKAQPIPLPYRMVLNKE